MVKEKFNELLAVMERLLMQEGYQKGRKKGTYHRTVSGKIMKLQKSNVFFLISSDSDMESVGTMIWAYLARFVFPLMRGYEDDEKLLGKFAGKTIAWQWNYSLMAKSDIDFYLKWIAVCVDRACSGSVHRSGKYSKEISIRNREEGTQRTAVCTMLRQKAGQIPLSAV